MNFPTALSEPAASLGAVFEECLNDDEEPGMEGNAPSILLAHPFVSGIDWNAAEAHVARLQRQLAQAVEHQNRSAIRHYKHLLRHSHHAKLLAIRLVTQENQGRKTPGVDGRIALTASQRDILVQTIDLERRPLPVRRVFIPKKNGKLRPLGIPTIQDRVGQALHKLAMEPEWDLQFEPNSYGFRPQRSTWDAIAQCFTLLSRRNSPPWVIEGDIQGFFDHVDHDKLLARLAPEDRGYVRRILQAPTLDPKRGLLANLRGTPQGGILSPLLANIALHGMETALQTIARHQGGLSNPSGVGIHIVRYADDFIITCPTKEQAEQCLEAIATWLHEQVGVELNREKTHITAMTEGFDFLGFNLRKYHGKLLIKPSKASQLAFLGKVKALLTANQTTRTDILLYRLNPLLRGWAYYYRTVVSKQVFSYCDYRLYQMLWQWARRRHPQKSKRWVQAKYFTQRGSRHWVFTDGQRDVFHLAAVPILRHIKVQGRRSPFRPADAAYYVRRRQQLLRRQWTGFQQRIVAKTAGQCGLCARPILEDPVHHQGPSVSGIRFHQMIPPSLGGQATLANVFVTHRWCQQQYVRRFGPHHLPDNPTRFLTQDEVLQDGRVVPARQSSPAHHTG